MQRPLRNSLAQPPRPAAGLRRGFSLIELMVVILIITILMSMLLVAVRGAMTRARVAAVVVEFKNLEKAVTDFKAKYGAEPPSGILVVEDSSLWSGTTTIAPLNAAETAAAISRSRALIRQIWPDFDFSLNRQINADGDSSDALFLSGAESLVFFLGGKPAQSGGTWSLGGFSSNGENPLLATGARTVFYEFDVGRLKDLDGDGMPEYLDSLPGQTKPILFASSYGGRGYRDADVQLNAPPAQSYNAYAPTPTGFAYAYRQYTGSYPATVSDFKAAPLFNAKSFQLISPGMDGEYGWGGVLNGDMELIEPRSERAFERDNITNFKGGTIN